MCTNQAGVGTLACAVLGAGTTAAGTAAAASTGPAPHSVKQVAVTVGHELARTGVNFTVTLAVVATLMILAGLLLVNLSRRHAPTRRTPFGLDPPRLA